MLNKAEQETYMPQNRYQMTISELNLQMVTLEEYQQEFIEHGTEPVITKIML